MQPLDDLKGIAESFNKRYFEQVGQIQKITSTTRYICFSLRYPGETIYLYIGRGGPYGGLWFHTKKPEKELRVKDFFLEYLRKKLTSSYLLSLTIDPHDRLMTLAYKKYGKKNHMLFFWKGHQLFFLNHSYNLEVEKWELFKSWSGKEFLVDKIQEESLNSLFVPLGKRDASNFKKIEKTHKKLSTPDDILELLKNERNDLQRKYKKDQGGQKKLKILQRKQQKIQSDLLFIKESQGLHQLIEKIQTQNHIDESDISILKKFKIKIRLTDNLYKNISKIYERIKKFKEVTSILNKRLEQVDLTIKKGQEDPENKPSKNILKPIFPIWPARASGKNQTPTQKNLDSKRKEEDAVHKHVKILHLNSSMQLGIGLDAKGNDYLRNKWGHKEDLWFHLYGFRGAHGVLKIHQKGKSDLTEDIWQIIGSALRNASRVDAQSFALIYTRLKNVKSVKGQPGKVLVKKDKRLSIQYDPNWEQKIKDR